MEDNLKYEPLSLERIQAEQDKHKLGDYYVPSVDGKSFTKCKEADFDTITIAIDNMVKDIQKETDLYIICEMAKLYVESQRPAKWVFDSDNIMFGNPYGSYKCTNCYSWTGWSTHFCPNCGKRMIFDKESNND